MNRTAKDRESARSGREVNNMLHTLRGEQFRHSQNLIRSKAHLAAVAARSYNDPSLPFSDIYKYAQAQADERLRALEATAPLPLHVIQGGQLQPGYPRGPVPGPSVPQSWSGLFKHDAAAERNRIAFRREALSLILSHMPWSFGSDDVPLLTTDEQSEPPSPAPAGEVYAQTHPGHPTPGIGIPPLAQISLGVLLAQFPETAEFRDELLDILPPRFYRDVLRFSAVHEPLPTAKLYALCGPEGHVDGELVVVGPQATLQRDILVSASPTVASRQGRDGDSDSDGGDSGDGNGDGDREADANDRGEGPSTGRASGAPTEDESSWETKSSSSRDEVPPMHTLVVLNTSVSIATLFAFPLTLTRLALLALPVPTPVHRLPRICPLLEVLDLSYNPWLNDPPEGKGAASAESTLERTEWEKWARLRVLGLRQCNAPESIATRVNRGRLLDVVHIVGIGDRTFGSSLTVVEGMMQSLTLAD